MDFDINDELVERILLDLRNVLRKEPFVDEFDILPVYESIQNKSPVIHVSNKLALESWIIKPLYVYVYNKFFAWKTRKLKTDSDTIVMWTCVILLLNPEIETVWNTRKLLINNFQAELKFSELVLSRKPKSSPVFAHRKWILLNLRKKELMCSEVIKQELIICSRVANLYPNNYYAWSHRSWIIQELVQTCLKSVLEELKQTEHWVSTHISDHSGFHYRQFLLSCLKKSDSRMNLTNHNTTCILHPTQGDQTSECVSAIFITEIHKEILFLSDLQSIYPGHETLWYHRRYLLLEVNEFMKQETEDLKLENLNNVVQHKKHKSESELKFNWNIVKEESFTNHCVSSCVAQNWEKSLISRHLKWLHCVLMWPVTILLS